MITIVDYGLGNIRAFSNMYKRMNIETDIATNAAALSGARRIVLPGVGAFDRAMELLQASGMREALDELVLGHKVPVLGICVGMQILAEGSDEGQLSGLSWIPGRVKAFRSAPGWPGLPLPHMGWNDVKTTGAIPLFEGLRDDARFYFLHSFYLECAQPSKVAATASYGLDFGCAVNSGNVYGVQFHPEKSHHWGARLLKNFAEL